MDIIGKINQIRRQLTDPDQRENAMFEMEILLQDHYPHLYATFNLQKATYQAVERDWRMDGVVTSSEYNLELRKVLRAFNELLTRVGEEEKRISGSNIRRGSDLSIVSCNRKKVLKKFTVNFDWKEENQIRRHFYLLTDQRFCQTDSLVKRLITILKDDRKKVKYPGFNKIQIQEVEITPDESLEEAQYFFRKAFNRNMSPAIKRLNDLDLTIDPKYPAFQNFIFLPFSIKLTFENQSWSVVKKLVDWIILDFSQLQLNEGRRYIFFLIFKIKEDPKSKPKKGFSLFGRRQKSSGNSIQVIHTDINNLQKVQEGITVLPTLTRVSKADIEDWYQQYESNEAVREEKVNALTHRLGGGHEWDMSYVEKELSKIVEDYRNREKKI